MAANGLQDGSVAEESNHRLAIDSMFRDNATLLCRQQAWLVKNRVRHSQFADIVQQRRQAKSPLRVLIEPQGLGTIERVFLHPQ